MTEIDPMTGDEPTTKLIREGNYIVEVEVMLVHTGHEWSPYLSASDVRRLDQARAALRAGDLAAAAKFGRVYKLDLVAAE